MTKLKAVKKGEQVMNRPIPLKELGLDIGSVLGTFFGKQKTCTMVTGKA